MGEEVVNQEITERSRKNENILRDQLRRVGQERAADLMGCSRSTVSRMQDADIRTMAVFAAALGLKIVPQHYKCAKPEIFEAAMVFASAAIANADRDSLMWDDEN